MCLNIFYVHDRDIFIWEYHQIGGYVGRRINLKICATSQIFHIYDMVGVIQEVIKGIHNKYSRKYMIKMKSKGMGVQIST